jgi:hypothetical protein
MKWPKPQVDIVLNGFIQFLDNTPHTLEEIRESYAGSPPMKVVYDIWRLVWMDMQFDDTNPRYSDGVYDDGTPHKGRKRLVQHCPEFLLYPSGCDDSHMKTMLKFIGKKCGLID